MKTQAKQFIILTMDMHPLRLVFVFLRTLIYPALFHTSFFNFLLVSFSAQGYTKRNMPSWTSSWHTVINKLTLFVRHLHHSLMNYFISYISNDDDDGSEKVAKKMNLRSFKLYCVYLHPLNMSNVGDVSWS